MRTDCWHLAIVIVLATLMGVGSTSVSAANLLRNGGFEAGLMHWFIHGARTVGETLSAVPAGAQEGHGCALLDMPQPGFEAQLVSDYVTVPTGTRVTLSARLRAEREGQPVLLRLWSWDPGTYGRRHRQEQTVTVGREWQRYSMEWTTVPAMQDLLRVNLVLKEPGKLWADAVQLQAGELTDYAPERPLELGLRPEESGNLYLEDQLVQPGLLIANHTGQAQRLTVSLTVTDFFDQVVSLKSVPVAVEPGVTWEQAVGLRPATLGYFRVEARLLDGQGTEVDGLRWAFGRLTRLDQPREKRFGLCMECENVGWGAAVTRRLGAGALRVHNSMLFGNVMPEPGKTAWEDEPFVKLLAENDLAPLIYLHGFPAWAGPQGSDQSVAAWREYVAQTVAHYKPWVKDWEIWNEPAAWVPDPKYYTRLLLASYEAAKAADPQCTVAGLCGFIADEVPEYNRRVFEAGGGASMDVLSLHPYIFGPLPEETLGPRLDRMRELMDQFGGRKPIWSTEYGMGASDWPSEPDMEGARTWGMDEAGLAQYLVSSMTLAFAHGVERFYWFLLPSHIYGGGFMPDIYAPDSLSSPKKGAIAYAVLARELNGLPFVERLETQNDNLHAYRFADDRRQVVVAWTAHEADRLPLAVSGGALSATDVMGNPVALAAAQGEVAIPLGRVPVYLHAPSSVTLRVSTPVTLALVAAIDAGVTPAVPLTVQVTNRGAAPLSGVLQAKLPEGWTVEPASAPVSLAPGAQARVTFTAGAPPTYQEARVRLRFELVGEGRQLQAVAERLAAFRSAAKTNPGYDVWAETESAEARSKCFVLEQGNGAYGRAFLHLETLDAPEGPEPYHWFRLPFGVTTPGNYALDLFANPLNVVWTSHIWWRVDAGEWQHVTNLPQHGEVYTPHPEGGDAQKWFAPATLGRVYLGTGPHLFEVKVDEVRQINPWYTLFADALGLKLVQ